MKRRVKLFFVAILSIGAFSTPNDAHAATILNGSFEVGSDPGSYAQVNAGDNTIANWTVDSGNIDYIGTYWTASQGNRSIDLNGVTAGSISQTISGLTPGQGYRVSFDYAGNPDGPKELKTLIVSSGLSQAYIFDTAGNSAAVMGWLTAYFYFVADATGVAKLVFLSGVASGGWGPAIDNVGISETPLPGALPLFASVLSGLGFFSWWKRRRLATA